MSYRMTKKATEQRNRLASMRHAAAARRMSAPEPDYPAALPDLRRRLVIESFDFGHEVHVLEFYKTDRIDCFRIVADGVPWKNRIGWSNALAGLRKSMPRVGSAHG